MATHVMTPHGAERLEAYRREASFLPGWLSEITLKLAASWAWYRDYRKTLRELGTLSNKELDDIGILPCDIQVIAMQSANAARETRLASRYTA